MVAMDFLFGVEHDADGLGHLPRFYSLQNTEFMDINFAIYDSHVR